ncbi:MAG: cytochrome P450 [Sandaracinaceae bacterium]
MIDTSTLAISVRRTVQRAIGRVRPGSRLAGDEGRREPGQRVAPTAGVAPLLGSFASGRERLDMMMRASLEHGHVVRFELPWVTAHMVTHPAAIEEVLVTKHRLFDKRTRGYDKLRGFLGNGLLTSDGDFWLRQRRIAAPAFHKRRIDGFAATMARSTEEMLDRWQAELSTRSQRDVSAEMMRLTLRIASLTLLSSDTESPSGSIAESIGEAVTVLVHEANQRINELVSLPEHWPTPRNVLVRRAIRTLDDTVLGIIAERRRALAAGRAADHEDLLQMFLEATDADTGARMDDRQLRDEVMTMFLAGHETTANGLAWAFYLLGKYPHVARALHEEAVTVLGDRVPDAEDVPRLELARRVFAEALRLYPPVWIVGRNALEDVELGGFLVPRRTLVFIVPWVTHRHPDFWRDPEGFDPDRFAPERRAEMPYRLQYLPFIAGPRMCIGAGFAQLEGALVLAQVARRFRLSLVPGQRIEPEPVITLRPERGVRVSLERW